MPTVIEADAPTTLAAADLKPRGAAKPHRSPSDWRDQILYFLLPDRFSDATGGAARPMFDRNNPSQHAAPVKVDWMKAGNVFQGGTIKGIEGRLPYLKGLGVTTLWVGPVWKQ